MPTILEWWGIEEPTDLSGASLLPILTDPSTESEVRSQFAEGCLGETEWKMIRVGSHKLIERLAAGAKPELYDLASDRGETRNLAELKRGKRDKLLERMGAAAPWNRARVNEQEPVPLDAETRERLKQLGYLDEEE